MNEPILRIEYGDENSLEQLRSLWLCLHHHHQHIAPRLGPFVADDTSCQTRRRFYADCLGREGSFVLLAYSEDDIVSYAVVRIEEASSMWRDPWVVGDRTAELETIVVAPDWRRKGVGTLLMDRVELELQPTALES
jgi:ribosomal protein S18 acetylase RimI-like enzyme